LLPPSSHTQATKREEKMAAESLTGLAIPGSADSQ